MPIPEELAEQAFLPYAPSLFEAARAVVLAPHADDEVFGCGAAIASLRSRGAAVLVAIVTDGAGDVAEPGERSRIAALRLAESRAALALLGDVEVAALGFRDRALLGDGVALRDALRGVLSSRTTDLVLAPAPSEVHPDHRAVARAVLELALAGDLEPRTLLAFYEVSQAIRPNFLLDATPWLRAKGAAVACFGSQLGGHDYARVVAGLMAFRSVTLGPAVTAAEGFFVTAVSELREKGVERLLRAVGPCELWA